MSTFRTYDLGFVSEPLKREPTEPADDEDDDFDAIPEDPYSDFDEEPRSGLRIILPTT